MNREGEERHPGGTSVQSRVPPQSILSLLSDQGISQEIKICDSDRPRFSIATEKEHSLLTIKHREGGDEECVTIQLRVINRP